MTQVLHHTKYTHGKTVYKGCDGEEIFPPVNRPDVTPVLTVSPWGGGGGGSFEFSSPSLGFK